MDLIQKQRASVAEHIRLENENDWSAVPLTLVQDERAFYDFVPVGQFKGIDGVRQLYQTIGAAFSDLHIEISAEYDVPGCSIREGVITATHTGVYGGSAEREPSQNRVCSIFYFRQDLRGTTGGAAVSGPWGSSAADGRQENSFGYAIAEYEIQFLSDSPSTNLGPIWVH